MLIGLAIILLVVSVLLWLFAKSTLWGVLSLMIGVFLLYCVYSFDRDKRKIIKFLKQRNIASIRETSQGTGINETHVRMIIESLTKEGKAELVKMDSQDAMQNQYRLS